jgi:ATP-dependent Lhr-like helicase
VAEAVPGGFATVYEVYRSMEERGRLRRGYFTTGVAAVQFALPAALDLLRSLREPAEAPEVVMLAATDPANPYGALLKWPATDSPLPGSFRGPTRSVGASVILVDGSLAAYLGRAGKPLLSFLPEHEPDRSAAARAVAARLAAHASSEAGRESGLIVAEINGAPAVRHDLAGALKEAGFLASAAGLHLPRAEATRPSHAPAGRTGAGRGAVSSPFGVFRDRGADS